MKKSSTNIRDVINVILSTGTKHVQVITTQLNRSLKQKDNDWRAIMQYISKSTQLLNTDMRWKDAVIATIHNLKRRAGGDLYTTWTTHQIWKNPTRQFVYTYVIFVYCDEKAVSLRAVSRTNRESLIWRNRNSYLEWSPEKCWSTKKCILRITCECSVDIDSVASSGFTFVS